MQAARRRWMATAATRIAHRRRQVLRLPSKKKAKGKRKQDKQKKKKITVRATVSNRFVCTQKWNQPTIDFPAVTGKSVSRHSARPPETLVTSHLLTIVPIPFAQQRVNQPTGRRAAQSDSVSSFFGIRLRHALRQFGWIDIRPNGQKKANDSNKREGDYLVGGVTKMAHTKKGKRRRSSTKTGCAKTGLDNQTCLLESKCGYWV